MLQRFTLGSFGAILPQRVVVIRMVVPVCVSAADETESSVQIVPSSGFTFKPFFRPIARLSLSINKLFFRSV